MSRDPVIVRACACHDSRGVSLDKDGTVTETYEVVRCAEHVNVPSIYRRLVKPVAKPASKGAKRK